jgi:hypothetical protein
MENNGNRRLLIAIGFVLLFAVVVIIWYFVYAKPVIAPSLSETKDPFPTQKSPPRFQFLTWGQEDTSTTTTEVTDPLALPLVKVWDKPATGQAFITEDILKELTSTSTVGTSTSIIKKTVRATSTVLIFVDRITGYVYGFPLLTGKAYQISNTLLPGIYDAYFYEKGTRVMMRYIDQDKNQVVGVTAEVPNVQENEMALPLKNIQYIRSKVTSVATNLKKDRIAYTVATNSGSDIYSLTKEGVTRVTSSPFGEWSLSYGGNTLHATTKPSAYIEGSTFTVPQFQSEVTEKTGLMSTPSSEGLMLNSMWAKDGLTNFITNNGDIKIASFKTLASKCSWGDKKFLVCAIPKMIPKTTEGLPDDWFQGRISFDDDFFIINSSTGDPSSLYTFKPEDGIFDVTNISISEGNNYLGFNKKQDASLWLLNLDLIKGE